MSGTNQIYNTVLSSLRTGTDRLVQLQEQVSTGQRINRASDSPTDAATVMQLQTRTGDITAFLKNLDSAATNLSQISTSLQSVTDALVRVKSLLTQAASGTLGPADRVPIANEIDGLLEQAVMEVNSSTVNGYLFAGSSLSAPPYRVTRSDGMITGVEYVGASDASGVAVGQNARQVNDVVGDAMFQSDQRKRPVLLGSTGLAAGSGTSTLRGDAWLTVTHTLTTYQDAAGTGLVAGSGSPAGDTILGTGHALTVDADSRTIRLDDGTAVAFDPSTDANLKLTNADGDVVYVDTTHFSATLTGTVTVGLTGQGRMTLDDGQTYANLTTFADNQPVTDSRTGRVLYVDASNLERTGTEPIRVPGTYDVFGMLISVRDLLLNTRGLSSSQQSALLGDALDSVSEVFQTVTAGSTMVGARQQAIDNLKTSLTTLKEGADSQKATLLDCDIADVATELARTQTFYQMTLQVASKVMNLSLLNYM